MAWYQRQWFYVERPFPWLIIGGFGAVLVGIIAFALVLGVLWWR